MDNRIYKKSRSLFVLAFSAFILHSVAVAQVDTGTISGTVKDQTGAVIQYAVVKVENGSAVSEASRREDPGEPGRSGSPDRIRYSRLK
jgi:hypothetical protein